MAFYDPASEIIQHSVFYWVEGVMSPLTFEGMIQRLPSFSKKNVKVTWYEKQVG